MTQTQTKEIKKELTASERFTQMIIVEFNNLLGSGYELTPNKKKLAQHLFIAIDKALLNAETERIKKGETKKLPIIWNNIDLQDLAKSAIHRINLGLDAFIENHIHIVPYFIENKNKYIIKLIIGYVGKDYYKRKLAIDPPKKVIYELIYETDHFKPIKKDINNEIENYEFQPKNAFNRGKIVGGFGYIIYDDPSKNELVLVSEDEFIKAKECAFSKAIWTKWPDRQRFKTIVHRTTKKISPDPDKINESYMIVEESDRENHLLIDIEENSNKKMIDIEPEKEEVRQEIKSEQQTQKPTAPVNRISKDGNTKIIDDNMQQESQTQMKGPGF